MPFNRFYLDAELKKGDDVQLQGVELHHLAHVMRIAVNETVELVNGKGTLAKALVKGIHKKEALLNLFEVKYFQKTAEEIILAQAIPRFNRLDFILEKGTELGMTQIWLFPGEISDFKKLTEHQLERMHLILVAAMKQCGSLWLPEIHLKPPLKKWDSLPENAFYGDVKPEAPPFLSVSQGRGSVLFAIGPESGFTESEEHCLHQLGAVGVKLATHILRTDTAALLAVGLIAQNSL